MKVEGVVAYLDDKPDFSGESFSSDCKVDIKDNIVVTHDFKKGYENVLGKAKVFKEEGVLKYKIEIFPEKLTKEEAELLTPCLGGHVLSQEGSVLKNISVGCVGLSLTPSDKRLKPLKLLKKE